MKYLITSLPYQLLLNLEEEDEMLSSGYAKSRMIISRLDIAHCLKITKNVSFEQNCIPQGEVV